MRYQLPVTIKSAINVAGFPRDYAFADDTAPVSQRRETRRWTNEHLGPIQSWDDFGRYPWPDPAMADTSDLEWCNNNLPDDMCLRGGACQIFEQVTWLMGYEGLCIAIYDQFDLVDAIFQRVGEIHLELNKIFCQFPRIGFLFGGDDMGFKTQTMIDPQILIDKAISWHKKLAEVAHRNGKLYLIHKSLGPPGTAKHRSHGVAKNEFFVRRIEGHTAQPGK